MLRGTIQQDARSKIIHILRKGKHALAHLIALCFNMRHELHFGDRLEGLYSPSALDIISQLKVECHAAAFRESHCHGYQELPIVPIVDE